MAQGGEYVRVSGVFEQFEVVATGKMADGFLILIKDVQKLSDTGFRKVHADDAYDHRRGVCGYSSKRMLTALSYSRPSSSDALPL